ncbi:ester cyclase [Leptospira sp. 201903071]|uniref:ester cyclase n=1 Tax=Leptospira ainazelensis TaxID=2810034 RepID=UPI0019661C17|nr:ester cyclase [Leptospira ainazelensis]MBM9498980.1 ester cyclase [Leptospira ainazelensis]
MKNTEKIEYILKELIQNNNPNSIQGAFARNYIVHTSKKDYKGHEIIKRWLRDLNKYFYDLKIVKIQFLVQTEEVVVWKRTLKGKIKPSKSNKLVPKKTIKWDEMVVSKFKDGFIIEEWNTSEFLGELLSKQGFYKN